MRTTHHDTHRCAQNADHLTRNRPFSAFFAEVVCVLGAAPPQATTPSPPNGGNGVIRDPTRRRHAASEFLMLQNPHRRREGTRATGVPPDAGPGCGTHGRRRHHLHPHFACNSPHDTNRCTLKNRRISTIRFQHLKYTQGNCMRNYYGMGGGGAWPGYSQHTRNHWCRGHRRNLPRCRWAAAGPGRASRRRAERSSRRGRLAGGTPPTGAHSGRGLRRPEHPWGDKHPHETRPRPVSRPRPRRAQSALLSRASASNQAVMST